MILKYILLSFLILFGAIFFDNELPKKVLLYSFDKLAFCYNYLYSPSLKGEIIFDKSKVAFFGQTYVLQGNVSISRDNDGTFHISSFCKEDAFFAQGYISGMERIYYLEIMRRILHGRLAELDPDSLIIDRLSRTLGFRRIAEIDFKRLDDIDRQRLESFTSGINFYLQTRFKKHKPLEFFLGRIPNPEAFGLIDCLGIIRIQAWSFSRGWIGKIMKVAIRQWSSEEFEKSLNFEKLKWNGDEAASFDSFQPFAERIIEILDKVPEVAKLDGSNSIAISSKISKTGKAMLEADPHLAVKVPSLWIPVHIVIDDDSQNLSSESFGYQLFASPGIAIGFNRNISYGITLSYADSADVFVEKISKDGERALYMDKWEDMKILEERIHVKGKPDYVEHVRITRNGPLLSGLLDFQNSDDNCQYCGEKNEYSLKMVPLLDYYEDDKKFEKKITHVKLVTDMFTTKNWKDFVGLCEKSKIVHVNFVYADSEDNIGICVGGLHPIRSKKNVEKNPGGLCEGWTDLCKWKGYQSKQPIDFNPKKGYIVSANHDYFGNKRPYYMGIHRSQFRANRISKLIEDVLKNPDNGGKISLEDLERISFDSSNSLEALTFVQGFGKIYLDGENIKFVEGGTITPEIVAEELIEFDGNFKPESSGASIYVVFINSLLHVLLKRIGGGLSDSYDGSERRRERLFMSGLSKKFLPIHCFVGLRRGMIRDLWNKERKINDIPTLRKEVLEKALLRTIRVLNNQIGVKSDNLISRDEWLVMIKFKNIHPVDFSHVLGEFLPSFGRIVGGWGSFDSPLLGGYTSSTDYSVVFYPTCKIVVDMGDVENARTMIYPGSSNYLNNPFMFDGIKHYKDKTTRKVVFSKKDVLESRYSGMKFTVF